MLTHAVPPALHFVGVVDAPASSSSASDASASDAASDVSSRFSDVGDGASSTSGDGASLSGDGASGDGASSSGASSTCDDVGDAAPSSGDGVHDGTSSGDYQSASRSPLSRVAAEMTGSSSPRPEVGEVADEEGGLTEEMIAENARVKEELLEEEEKKKDLLAAADKGHSNQKYQQLEFLLQKSTTYTQYLFNRMKSQQEEIRLRAERKAKKEKKRKEKQEEKQKEEEKENDHATKTTTRKPKRKRNLIEDDDDEEGEVDGTPDAKKLKPEVGEAGVENVKDGKNVTTLTEDNILPSVPDRAEILTGSKVDTFSRLVNGERVSDLQPQLFTGGVLREYQIKGYTWMKSLFENGINGILADEMGLGKTVQCISLIAHLISEQCQGPFLVVAPLSTIPNWYSEFRRFTPFIPVMIHHGAKEARHAKARKIYKQSPAGPWSVKPVVLSSYEMIIQDRKLIGHHSWKCLIIDEGHRLKNMNCRLIRELKQFNACNRLLLTGTPLQNNLSELWSLLNFLLPEIFDDLTSFESWFDMRLVSGGTDGQAEIVRAERENNVLTTLHSILEPFLLRRLKTDVKLDIPPKREVLVYAPLTKAQEDFYKSAVDRTIQSLLESKNDAAAPHFVHPPSSSSSSSSSGNGDPLVAENADDSANVADVTDVADADSKDESVAGVGARTQRRSRLEINYAFFDSGERQAKSMNLLKADSAQDGKKKLRKVYADESSDDDDDDHDDDGEIESWYEQVSRMTSERERKKVEVQTSFKTGNLIRLQLRNIMMLLRRVCNHPFLIDHPRGEMENPSCKIVNVCGKMMILDQMLVRLKKKGHKVLVFSQMTQMLDVIADYLDFRGFDHSRLDGSMKMEERQEHIHAFNTDPERFVFLLSTRAGGLGLNLMAADTVIIYDSDWNPQCDLQAQDRAHRMGQKRPVMVYRLITANTIDQSIVERAAAKRRLEKMVIKKGRFQDGDQSAAKKSPISPQELLDLLQSRDQDKEIRTSNLRVTKDNVNWSLSEKECEELLDRSDLYARWEEDRKLRNRTAEGVEEKKKKAVREESFDGKIGPGVDGIFAVVDTTTSGVTAEDLV